MDNDDNNETPLLIRIPSSNNDANDIDRKVGEHLATLTPEQQANLNIPTAAEVSRAGLVGDVQDSNVGTPQQNIELNRLTNELEVIKARVVEARRHGHVPNKLMNEFTAKANSLQYQADRIRATTPDPVQAGAEADQATLLSAYRTDMQSAVNQMMRSERVTKDTAIRLVERKIETFGAATVLPQFGRIEARMNLKYPKADPQV